MKLYLFILALLLFSCSGPSPIENVAIDDTRLIAADQHPTEWLSYGRNYYEDRYSPLNQINKSTVDSLGLAWSINLGTRRGLEATPIVANGVMYFTGPWSVVYAVDARRGEILWTYDPEVPKAWGEKVCCDVVNRGVAIYNNLIYFGSLDGRLIALNAENGEKAWEVVTVNQSKPYSITGAPRVVKGNVIIGNGGAEYGVRGYVTAYDALTGKQAWRFLPYPAIQPIALKVKRWSKPPKPGPVSGGSTVAVEPPGTRWPLTPNLICSTWVREMAHPGIGM